MAPYFVPFSQTRQRIAFQGSHDSLNTCTTRSTEKDVGTHKMFRDQGCITKIGQGGKELF